MKRYPSIIATGLMLAALAPLQSRAAENTWNNGSADSLWNLSSANWTSPAIWSDGADALFGATGAGTVMLAEPITVGNQTFTAGYTIDGGGYPLTLAGTTPTITVNANATNAASIYGTNGLTVQGTGVLTLEGEHTLLLDGNHYTGGTYVRGGTLILAATGASTVGPSYAVDSIEAIDAGAIVREGNTNDGLDTPTSQVNLPNGQIPISGDGSGLAMPHRLNLTGGTYDAFASDNKLQQPQPSGTGTIINTCPVARGILKFTGYGETTEFAGQIMDGGQTVARANSGPGYQMNVDSQNGSSASVLILSGSNSFTGFIRIGNGATFQLKGAGTMGYPAPINIPQRHVIQNNGKFDLNGTSQKTGYWWTKRDTDGCRITNSAFGTLSTITLCYNCTNTTVPAQSGSDGGISCSLQDDPATGGTLGITKEGIAPQVIGDTVVGVNNNYHGDTVVNNGVLRIVSEGGISPNSAYRVTTALGATLDLAYPTTANARQLWIDGVQQPNGVYGAGTPGIDPASTGTITVTGASLPNTWNNGAANFTWDLSSANWTSPTAWVDGNDAIFGATGAGAITLGEPVTVGNQTFNAAGYDIIGYGYPLTLAGTSPTITVNADTTNTASLYGTNGLTIQGNGVLTLQGDTAALDGNHYTGGTYVKSGTLILQAPGASSVGTAYAVDSIEALDAGATVKMGSTFDGATWSGPARDQIAANSTAFASHLHMTGGTLDLYNDPKNQRVPVPDGTGLIINTGPDVQTGLNVIMDGLDHTFSGVIADGNNGVLIGDNSGQGPGYQIGIVSISGTAGSTWTLAGDNTYSGSTRIDGGTIVKLAGNHSLGIPTTNSLTGPLRVQNGALDLNGRNQTIALMTDGGGPAVKIYNSAVGTVSTLTVGYGNEQANRNIGYQLMDNTGVGGIFALRKIITAPFLQGATLVTNCTQGLKATCVATYSGDTTVDGGTLNVQGPSAISPNSAYRLSTNNYASLWLNYSGDAPVRQLWINGVQQPNGTYGAGTPGIDPTSTGTITVTGSAPATLGATHTGNNLNFTWEGVYKLQVSINSVTGPWVDVTGGGLNSASVPINPENTSAFYRLVTY